MESALTRGKRFHVLPAITVDGILDALVYQGSTTSDGFVAWLSERVLPKMNKFPARNSILVMDNASWHHGKEVGFLAGQAGVLIWYLPPYSPDFNPIEAFFSDLKAYFRRHYSLKGGDGLSLDEFRDFLALSVDIVGKRIEAIRGHYKEARLVFREEEEEAVDYGKLYCRELLELQTIGTIL